MARPARTLRSRHLVVWPSPIAPAIPGCLPVRLGPPPRYPTRLRRPIRQYGFVIRHLHLPSYTHPHQPSFRIDSVLFRFIPGLSGSQTMVVVFALRKPRRRAQRQATEWCGEFSRRDQFHQAIVCQPDNPVLFRPLPLPYPLRLPRVFCPVFASVAPPSGPFLRFLLINRQLPCRSLCTRCPFGIGR